MLILAFSCSVVYLEREVHWNCDLLPLKFRLIQNVEGPGKTSGFHVAVLVTLRTHNKIEFIVAMKDNVGHVESWSPCLFEVCAGI